MLRVTDIAHLIVRSRLTLGAVAVDATVGNGHDTRMLVDAVGPTGRVFGFDIQPEALARTSAALISGPNAVRAPARDQPQALRLGPAPLLAGRVTEGRVTEAPLAEAPITEAPMAEASSIAAHNHRAPIGPPSTTTSTIPLSATPLSTIPLSAIPSNAWPPVGASHHQTLTLIEAGHERMTAHVPAEVHGHVAAIMFNLGYLPGAPKHVTTAPKTTIAALEQATGLLAVGGVVTVIVYPGHPGGSDEADAVRQHVAALPPKFNTHVIARLRAFNAAPERLVPEQLAPERPVPELLVIERLR